MDTTTALAAPEPEPDRPDDPCPPGPAAAALEEQLHDFVRERERILGEQQRSALEPVAAAIVGATVELRRIADALQPVEPADDTQQRTMLCTTIAAARRQYAAEQPDSEEVSALEAVAYHAMGQSYALDEANATIGRVRVFAEDMRTWCSPHGVAADYADRLLAVVDEQPTADTPTEPGR